MQYEYEKASLVQFLSITEDAAVTYSNGGTGHIVSNTSCSCMYFTAMSIPCRHIFQFLLSNQLDAFVPDICATRWKLDYYYNAHPAINESSHVPPPQPASFVKLRIPSEIQKYKQTATVTRDINNLMSNMSNAQFNYFYGKLVDLKAETLAGNQDNADFATSIPNRNPTPESSTTSVTTFRETYKGIYFNIN